MTRLEQVDDDHWTPWPADHPRAPWFHAVDDVDLTAAAGETLGLGGESGCCHSPCRVAPLQNPGCSTWAAEAA